MESRAGFFFVAQLLFDVSLQSTQTGPSRWAQKRVKREKKELFITPT